MSIINFTLNYSPSVKNRNGYALQTASLTDLAKLSINKSKIDQPVCYVYSGIKGTYNPTNIFFIDIDKEVVEVFNDPDKLFSKMPCVKAIQKSFSGKLHIFIEYGDKISDEDSYNETSLILHAFTNEVINKEYGIDLYELGKVDNKEYLDTHNAKWTQGLFISSYEPVYNLNWYLTKIAEHTIKILKEKYDFIGSKTNHIGSKTNQSGDFTTSIKEYKGERVKVDRDFCIAGYKGNEARWRISNVFLQVFGDPLLAKCECDKRFYYENGKSIFSIPRTNRTINKAIRDELIKLGYLDSLSTYDKSECDLFLNKDEYLSDKKDELLNLIKDYDRVAIQSPTGSGKTTWIKSDFIKEYKDSVIITPFNATNGIYGGIYCVSSSNNNKVPKNGCCCMVADQAVKHWEELKGKTILIDESHLIFYDRTYRKAVLTLLQKLKGYPHKIVLISATLSGEVEVLGSHVIKVEKELPLIHTMFIVNNNEVKQLTELYEDSEMLRRYNHVVIFTNKHHKYTVDFLKLLYGGDQVASIRSSNKETDDYKRLIETEKLDKFFTVCTCIANVGLNFKNEDEEILVIVDADVNETTIDTIDQQVGRNRKSNTFAIIAIEDKELDGDMEEKIKEAKKFDLIRSIDKISSEFMSVDEQWLDDETNDAKREIASYIQPKTGVVNLYNELKSRKRYVVNIYTKLYDKERVVNKYKKDASNKFREDFIRDFSTAYNAFEKGSYEYEWSSQIRRIMDNYSINEETLQNYVNNYAKEAMMKTILDTLDWSLRVSTMDLDDIKRQERIIEGMIANTTDKNEERKFKGALSLIKKAYKVREEFKEVQYKLIFDAIPTSDEEALTIFLGLKEEEKCKRTSLKKSEGGKKGGKKGSPAKKLKDPKTGKIYKSCEEAASKMQVSLGTISKKIKKSELIRI